jgi:hypothetical protein
MSKLTEDEVEELFETHGDEHSKSKRIPKERRLSYRDDIQAFMMLDKLLPPTEKQKEDGKGLCDIVCAAEHDKIWLGVDYSELADAGITEEQIIDLIRCGCMAESEGISMFV